MYFFWYVIFEKSTSFFLTEIVTTLVNKMSCTSFILLFVIWHVLLLPSLSCATLLQKIYPQLNVLFLSHYETNIINRNNRFIINTFTLLIYREIYIYIYFSDNNLWKWDSTDVWLFRRYYLLYNFYRDRNNSIAVMLAICIVHTIKGKYNRNSENHAKY